MRAELIHPLIIHFPIAFLLMASALRLAYFFLRQSRFGKVILFSSWALCLLGVCFAWLAVLAGEIAEDIVRSSLCKPDVLVQHKNLAYSTAVLFSFALIFDFGKFWIKEPLAKLSFRRLSGSFELFFTIAVPILYLIGTTILVLTGRYGASLVYDQGAAVEKICN